MMYTGHNANDSVSGHGIKKKRKERKGVFNLAVSGGKERKNGVRLVFMHLISSIPFELSSFLFRFQRHCPIGIIQTNNGNNGVRLKD